jgi:hypothetical protein
MMEKTPEQLAAAKNFAETMAEQQRAAEQRWAETVAELKAVRANARGKNLESFWYIGEKAEAIIRENRQHGGKSLGDLAAALGIMEESVWAAKAFHKLYSEDEMRNLGALPHITSAHICVLVRVPDPVERAQFLQQMADGKMRIWDLERILENRRQARITAERKLQKKEEIRALRTTTGFFRALVSACANLCEAADSLDKADQEYRKFFRDVPYHERFQALKERHAGAFALYGARYWLFEKLQVAAAAKELGENPVMPVPAPDADEQRVTLGDLHQALFADYYEPYRGPSEHQRTLARFKRAATVFRQAQGAAFGAVYALGQFERGLKEVAQMPDGNEKAENLQRARDSIRMMHGAYLQIIEVIPRIVRRQNPPERRR